MKRLLLSVSLFALPLVALAHGGLTHVMGTVATVSSTEVDVNTTGGKLAKVHTDGSTKWVKGHNGITGHDVHAGDRVVIHAKPVNGTLIAVEVAVGTATH